VIGTRSSSNLALARQIFDWFDKGDTDAFLATLHPDVEAHPSIGDGRVLEGREAVSEWMAGFMTHAEIEARPLDYELQGDCVIVRGYLRHRDGRTLAESQVFWVYQFRDGQIVRMESHQSRSAALAAC
jgi:ketosteroid isomerase-like protein